MADAKKNEYLDLVKKLEYTGYDNTKRLEAAQRNNNTKEVEFLTKDAEQWQTEYNQAVENAINYLVTEKNYTREKAEKQLGKELNEFRKENKLPGAEETTGDKIKGAAKKIATIGAMVGAPLYSLFTGGPSPLSFVPTSTKAAAGSLVANAAIDGTAKLIDTAQDKAEGKTSDKEIIRDAKKDIIEKRKEREAEAEAKTDVSVPEDEELAKTDAGVIPQEKRDELPAVGNPEAYGLEERDREIESTSDNKPVNKNRKSFRDYVGDVGNYATALTDTIGAAYKQRANNARSLAGYAGQFAPSGGQPFSEEAAKSPFQRIREQAYENVNSRLRAEQAAINAGEQQKITNEYKSVYDIAAMDNTARQAYIAQVLGEVSNGLQLDLKKDLRKVDKEELNNYLMQLQKRVQTISDNIATQGVKEGLIASIGELMALNAEGKLEERLLGSGGLNPVQTALGGAYSIGNGIASFIGKGIDLAL